MKHWCKEAASGQQVRQRRPKRRADGAIEAIKLIEAAGPDAAADGSPPAKRTRSQQVPAAAKLAGAKAAVAQKQPAVTAASQRQTSQRSTRAGAAQAATAVPLDDGSQSSVAPPSDIDNSNSSSISLLQRTAKVAQAAGKATRAVKRPYKTPRPSGNAVRRQAAPAEAPQPAQPPVPSVAERLAASEEEKAELRRRVAGLEEMHRATMEREAARRTEPPPVPPPLHWAPQQDPAALVEFVPLDLYGTGTGQPAYKPTPAAVASLTAAGVPDADAHAALEACCGDPFAALLHATSAECHKAGGAAALAAQLPSTAHSRRAAEAEAAELEAVLSAVDRCPPEQQQMYYMPQRPVDRSRVVSVHRVQNRQLWSRYVWCRHGVAKAAGGDANEQLLFHGSAPATLSTIAREGFDTRVSRESGMLGQGAYFAWAASYSLEGYARRWAMLASANNYADNNWDLLVGPHPLPPPALPPAPAPPKEPDQVETRAAKARRQSLQKGSQAAASQPAPAQAAGAAAAGGPSNTAQQAIALLRGRPRRTKQTARRGKSARMRVPVSAGLQPAAAPAPQQQQPQQQHPAQQPPQQQAHQVPLPPPLPAPTHVQALLQQLHGPPAAAAAPAAQPAAVAAPPPHQQQPVTAPAEPQKHYMVVFLCSVALGRICLGQHQLRRPPTGFDSTFTGRGAASSFGSGGHQEIYCAYDNAQAYPSYLLHVALD